MDNLTDNDWKCLEMIDDGEPVTLAPDAVLRLMGAKFIHLRHDRKPVITGLGRDAVMRKQYNFGLPVESAEDTSSEMEL